MLATHFGKAPVSIDISEEGMQDDEDNEDNVPKVNAEVKLATTNRPPMSLFKAIFDDDEAEE